MKILERFPEPWEVREREGGFAVHDANGVYLAGVGHREGLTRREAEVIAAVIARIKELLRRPSY